MTGLEAYESDEKKKSRRWITSELFRRIPEPNFATVLYLPGPVTTSDYQRKSLMSVGFRNENIIGVDYGDNVKAVRDLGGYCIKGSLCDVVQNWNESRKIDVIIADLCCGIDSTLDGTVVAIGAHAERAKATPVVYFNLQRGRDSYSNLHREDVQRYMMRVPEQFRKHRGAILINGMIIETVNITGMAGGIRPDQAGEAVAFLFKSCDPKFYSYRNTDKSVFMDGIIFKWHSCWSGEGLEESSKMKSKIAATLATATRRRLAA